MPSFVSDFMASPGIQALVAVLSVLGFVFSVLGIVVTIRWSPRRSNEVPRRGRPLRAIRFWRPSHYSLALGYLNDFCDRLKKNMYHSGTERGRVSEADLVRWILQIALTCAAQMVPQSLGKATLFRVSQVKIDETGRTTDIAIYSSEYVGIYSANQVTSTLNGTFLRNFHLNEHQPTDECPAALQCIAEGLPIIQSMLRRRAAFDDPERSLGTTHILAIPLVGNFHEVKFSDQIVSITIELKFSRFGSWILDRRDMQKRSLFRRANALAVLLSAIPQLSNPRFLPIVDQDSFEAEGGEEDEAGGDDN